MTSYELPREWSTWISSHELFQSGDLKVEAVRNMLVFPLSDIRAAAPRPEGLDRLLMEAFHAFCVKAERLRFAGSFYAWFDEMSGTLRCSACSAGCAAELPFACQLDIVDAPHEVTRGAASSKYIRGIPAAELKRVDTGSDVAIETELRLAVFVRPLIRAA